MGKLARFIHFYTDEDDGNGGEKGVLKTVSGALLHIVDALAKPAHKFTATLEPIQDLHGQDAPYPAGGGTNLLNIVPQSGTVSGISYSVDNDAYITLNGTAGFGCNIYLAEHIAAINTKITLSSDVNIAQGIYTGLVQQNGSSGLLEVTPSYRTKTSGDDGVNQETRYRIYIVSGTVLNNFKFRVMLNYGATALDFAPYSNICPSQDTQGRMW